MQSIFYFSAKCLRFIRGLLPNILTIRTGKLDGIDD